jgi:hypothetical protein
MTATITYTNDRTLPFRPRAALAMAWFAVYEGGEAWHGELACGG